MNLYSVAYLKFKGEFSTNIW